MKHIGFPILNYVNFFKSDVVKCYKAVEIILLETNQSLETVLLGEKRTYLSCPCLGETLQPGEETSLSQADDGKS